MSQLLKQKELFEWLNNLDLSYHFDHFLENGYKDLETCKGIGEADLQIIGIYDIHERIALLQAIRYLRQQGSNSNASASAIAPKMLNSQQQTFGSIFNKKKKDQEAANHIHSGSGGSSGISSGNNSTSTSSSSGSSYYASFPQQQQLQQTHVHFPNGSSRNGSQFIPNNNNNTNNYEECDAIVLDRDAFEFHNGGGLRAAKGERDNFCLSEVDGDDCEPVYEIVSPVPPLPSQSQPKSKALQSKTAAAGPSASAGGGGLLLHQIYQEPLDSELFNHHSKFSQSNPNLLWAINNSSSCSTQQQQHPLTPSHQRQRHRQQQQQQQQKDLRRGGILGNVTNTLGFGGGAQAHAREEQKYNLQRANLILRTAELQHQLRQQQKHHQQFRQDEINNISRTCDDALTSAMAGGPSGNGGAAIQYAAPELSSDNVLPSLPHSLLQYPLSMPPNSNGFNISQPHTSTSSGNGLYASVDHLFNFDYCLEPGAGGEVRPEFYNHHQEQQLREMWLGEQRKLFPNGASTATATTTALNSCTTSRSPGSKQQQTATHRNGSHNACNAKTNFTHLLLSKSKSKCATTKNSATSTGNCNSNNNGGRSMNDVLSSSRISHGAAGNGTIPTVSGLVAATDGCNGNGHGVSPSHCSQLGFQPSLISSLPPPHSACNTLNRTKVRQHHHHQQFIHTSHNNNNNASNEDMTINSAMNSSLYLPSPEHSQQHKHQYLQHVIVTSNPECNPGNSDGKGNSNINFGASRLASAPSSFLHPLQSPTRSKQVYTPGIYSPSSCLLEKDEIYDYAPPLQSKHQTYCNSSPAASRRSLQNASLSPFKSKGKSKSTLSCYRGASGEGGSGSTIGKSASHRNSPKRKFATIKNSSKLSYALSRSVSMYAQGAKANSSPTYVNTCSIESVTGQDEDDSAKPSPSSNGCRTLTKLSRRLGLARLFRTLRLNGTNGRQSESIEIVLTSRNTNFANKLNESGANQSQLSVNGGKRQISQAGKEQSSTSLSSLSLPSNERIIETINRLKYEDFQRRKERIAQQEQEQAEHEQHLNWGSEPKASIETANSEDGINRKQSSKKKKELKPLEFGTSPADDEPSEFANNQSPTVSPSKLSFIEKVKGTSKKLRKFSLKNRSPSDANDQVSSPSSSNNNVLGGDGQRSPGFYRTENPLFSEQGEDTELHGASFHPHSDAINIGQPGSCFHHQVSEEESLPNSINGVGGSGGGSSGRNSQLGSLPDDYNGPFVGKAVALVDCTPSPYDQKALRYKKGEVIDIISKIPTGLWIGKVNGQVGHFKFINVEILPNASDEDEVDSLSSHDGQNNGSGNSYGSSQASSVARRRAKRSTSLTPWEAEQRQTVANVINGLRKENATLLINSHSSNSLADNDSSPLSSQMQQQQSSSGLTTSGPSSKGAARRRKSSSAKQGRPKSVGDLLRRINLEEHISVFILHGFESLDLFKELEEEDLDRLAIMNSADRGKLLTAVELLREFDTEEEIPPIIIPTYSAAETENNPFGQDEECNGQNGPNEYADINYNAHNNIITPPPNFTKNSGKMVRDSGVFVKCDDDDLVTGAKDGQDGCMKNYDEDDYEYDDDKLNHPQQQDPEVEEIILSPANLPVTATATELLGHGHKRSSDSKPSTNAQVSSVRQRFLNAKSLFEAGSSQGEAAAAVGLDGQSVPVPTNKLKSPKDNARFLYCEKSSDSGISVGANSPPPARVE